MSPPLKSHELFFYSLNCLLCFEIPVLVFIPNPWHKQSGFNKKKDTQLCFPGVSVEQLVFDSTAAACFVWHPSRMWLRCTEWHLNGSSHTHYFSSSGSVTPGASFRPLHPLLLPFFSSVTLNILDAIWRTGPLKERHLTAIGLLDPVTITGIRGEKERKKRVGRELQTCDCETPRGLVLRRRWGVVACDKSCHCASTEGEAAACSRWRVRAAWLPPRGRTVPRIRTQRASESPCLSQSWEHFSTWLSVELPPKRLKCWATRMGAAETCFY